MQTAGAITVAAMTVTRSTPEVAAGLIAAKIIDLANITCAGRGTRIGVHCAVPRGYRALVSQSGSCEHGCGDQCSRQKLELSHSISPFDMKSQPHLAPVTNGDAIRLIKGTYSHVASTLREVVPKLKFIF
jgi:hypothetical protein